MNERKPSLGSAQRTQPTSGTAYSGRFVQAVTRVLANEGGYAKLPGDPCGQTRFGISHREYPEVDLPNLTRDGAIAIYFRDFWKGGRYSELPAAIAIKLFDLSVNVGAARATRCLQRALRACGFIVVEDGALGNGTIAGANGADGGALLAALRSEAAGYYRAAAEKSTGVSEGGESIFLAGWLNRAYQ
jgi:lysozyme family protein